MKNVLLTVIAVVLIGALGFGVFAYFDTRDNVKELSSNKVAQQDKKEESSTEQPTEQPTDKSSQQSSEQSNTTEENTTPEMVDVLNMIDAGENVDGIIDQEGNTWTMNPGKAVSYVNPKGEEYIASLNYTGEIDGIDFELSNEGVEGESSQGELYPDSKVVDRLQSEIDNAGLQTEMEQKQKELDDYLESFE